MTSTPKLLVVDDEPGMLALVERFAATLGYEVVRHTSGRDALSMLAAVKPDVALVDLRMPDIDGIGVLRAIRGIDPACAVVLMTGHASVETAIDAVKQGALDYLQKPLDLDRLRDLLIGVRDGIERREALLNVDEAAARRCEFHGMIGRSAAMQELFDTIRRLAPHARTVLITGETGTGKELVARAFHQLGPRRQRKFVMVNCSAVVETLFESELFGHVRGAFTGATEHKVGLFEHADGGTLFLDEVGELPLAMQAKLLRAVEYGEVQRVGSLEARKSDVHVVAATNRELRAEAASGRFRRDLFYRLGIVEVQIVPLRERREDIPLLTAALIRECSKRLQKPLAGVTPAAERLLQSAAWPGNVRELRNAIERACILADGRLLTERELSQAIPTAAVGTGRTGTVSRSARQGSNGSQTVPDESTLLTTAQREQIKAVLRQVNGNKTAAARLLGLSRRSLYRWLERIGPLS